ncbi:MAG TPA: discoidin domain-containing protein [Bryobacteraceae bacterium]|nr:discoidin domain-containing protein [Bryobacteraceae bacterium]
MPTILAAQTVTFTEFPTPTSGAVPLGITSGPDGALWYTYFQGNKIGRVTTSGQFTEFTLSTSSTTNRITNGPDGALWFTDVGTGQIGRITTSGATTEFPIASGANPFGIVTGPDGALWFADDSPGKIGRITTAGVVTEFSLPSSGSRPVGIAAGPDGALWFTELFNNKIGRITTGGVITEFTIPTSASEPEDIIPGPDGALWFTELSGNKIGRITTSGAITEFTVPTASSSPEQITIGPDGALWFTEGDGNKIARITTGGVITEYPTPSPIGDAAFIVAGSDGALWFTESDSSKIGRAKISSSTPSNCSFSLSASSTTVGPSASTGAVTVTAAAGCTYTVSAPSGSFATITSPSTGSGTSSVSYSVQANSGGSARTTTLTIAGLPYTINQLNGCVLGLTPSSASFDSGATTNSFFVGASNSSCTFTAASNNTSFLVVNNAVVTSANSSVSYTLTANQASASRTGTITVTGQGAAVGQTQTFTVIQRGQAPCTFALAQAGQAFPSAGGTGTVSVLAPGACPWSVASSSPFVTITGGGGGSGNGTVTYSVQQNSGSAQRIGSLTVAGLPYVVTQAGASTLNCAASVPTTSQIAIEGRTEVLGDLFLTCTGLTSALTANISLTLNTNVTNAITSTFSDALIQVNGAAITAGVVAGYNTVNWTGVSLSPSGGTAVARITNVKADASLLGGPASLQSVPVSGTVSIGASVAVPITNATQIMAYAGPTLVFQKGVSTTISNQTTIPLQFQEASLNAFKTGTSPTRLRVVLQQIPAGVQVSAPIFNSDASTRAQLLSADSNGQGGSPISGSVGSYQSLVSSGGTATATWVVNSSDPNSFETNTFPLVLQSSGQDLSQIVFSASFAPISQVSIASPIGTVPVPRYRDFSQKQSLVNLRSRSSVLTGASSFSADLSGHSLLTSRLSNATAGGTGSFGNQVNNDDQDNSSMGTTAGTTVSGGTITGCTVQPPATGSCTVSPDGSSATANLGQVDPGQSATYTIGVAANPCPTGSGTCAVQENVSVSSSNLPTADVTSSNSSSAFVVAACTPGTPGTLLPTGGNNQTTPIGTAFSAPLQVTLTDTCGSPLGGQSVTFGVPSTGPSATLSNGRVTTDGNGVATVTAIANSVLGTYNVSASVGTLNASFTLTNGPNGGKNATQSSSYPGSPSPNVAIDGNTDGNYGDGSVTATNLDSNPWWQLDQSTSVSISSIVIWNRTDCCSSRLSDYWVFVSDTPFQPGDTPSTLASRAGTFASHQTSAPSPSTTIPVGASGRYVRVQLSSSGYLSLAEVQIIVGGPPPNGASQSSTLFGTPPAGAAFDGNTDGNFYDGSVTATNFESTPWWQVNLGAAQTVGSVVIWNRTDCCGSRLSDYWVFVSNTPFLSSDTPATLASRAGTFASHQTSAPSPSTTIPVGITGQYVRVQLSGVNYLSLAEVQVLGGQPPPPPNSDLIKGKPASQSSTLPGSPASFAADGNTDGNYFDGSVTATNFESTPWWQVDLGAPTSLGTVFIWNRTDCCGSRLSDYWVFFSNTPFSPSDTPASLSQRGDVDGVHLTNAPSPSQEILTFGNFYRYIRVQLTGTGYLSLAEVTAFAPVNIAPGKTASQSSTLFGAPPASVAIDNNTDGNFFDGSVTATNFESTPFWQVDLGQSTGISHLVLWNRTDCCGSRLSNYWVFVSDTPFSPSDTPATLQFRANTFSSFQSGAPSPAAFIGVVQSGRYVRIQLTSPNYLSIAEVQVFQF